MKIAKELKRLPLIRIGDIQELQGNLKDLTEVNYQKLLKRLEKVGFKYPLYIWFDENKTPYTLDGKQRHRVIQKEYGADIKLPYIEVYAKNKIEAKKEILAISSDYGTVTKDGFDDFVGEFSEFDYSEIFLETTFDKWADIEPESEPETKESYNFTIECSNNEEFESLQTKLNTGTKKLSYKEFLLKAAI